MKNLIHKITVFKSGGVELFLNRYIEQDSDVDEIRNALTPEYLKQNYTAFNLSDKTIYTFRK